MAKGTLYAVYGTLRRGFGNYNRLLNNTKCTYLGKETTKPAYTMVSLGGFPGVIVGGNQSIVIEVFDVEDKVIERSLDYLEGYPSFYGKTTIQTQWGPASMYILDASYLERKRVESGDWAEHVGKK